MGRVKWLGQRDRELVRVKVECFARGYRTEMALLLALQPAIALEAGQVMFSVYCTRNDVDAG
jgi:hypothetical protein